MLYTIIEWATLASIPAFIVLDLIFRARRWRSPPGWRLRALAVTVFTIVWGTIVATFWGGVFGGASLFDLSGLGAVGGAVVGVLVYELGHYWYHRAMHSSDTLWRVHQMHHSAESLDAFGANWVHPIDTANFATITSLVLFPLLGLSLEAGVLAAAFITGNAMFQHANIRTPRWLGYIIQRPESHALHHGRGVQRYNYADLPLWDMVFGTFRNPKEPPAELGFYDGASSRVLDQLLLRDVTTPKSEEAELEPAPLSQPAVSR